MESLLLWIVAFTALGGVLSVLGAAVFLLLPDGWIQRLLNPLVSFAIGALLGAAFLALLPHAFESFGAEAAHRIPLVVLAGVLGFFLLEKLVLWRHCHTHECEVHGGTNPAHDSDVQGRTSDAEGRSRSPGASMSGAAEVHGAEHERNLQSANASADVRARAAGNLILIGDGIHNLVDGVLIAAAFLTDVHLGIVTSLAVIAHEIPQELGDFAILLHSGYSRARALLYNVLTSLTTVIGGVIAYFSLSFAQGAVPYVLAVAAASFIYIAVADLIPSLHKRPQLRDTVQQVALILLGVGVIAIAHSSLH